MESSASTFRYRPLEPESDGIRVVTIEPGVFFDSPIRCTLANVDLNTTPHFEALSYVWGDASITLPIQLETDASFPVTKNLERVLRYLRLDDSPRTLWIDAISIDQQNVPERNEQVQKMARIYESASKVLLWVGEEDDVGNSGHPSPIPIQHIFAYLDTVTAIVNRVQGTPMPAECYQYDPYEQQWEAGLQIFESRAWFKRLWIVQEAVLNPNTDIICGCCSMSWEHFGIGFMMLARAIVGRMTDSPKIDHRFRLMSRLDEVRMWADTWRGKHKHASIHVLDRIGMLLFLLNGDFDSTDPRDRLYAILGISGAGASLAQWPGLTVSYEKTMTEVFRDLAITIMEDRKVLAILAGYDLKWRHSKALSDKPSWVPTWGFEDYCNLREMALNRVGDTTGLRAIVRFSEDRNTLFAHGIEVGRIAVIGPQFIGGVGREVELGAQFKEWEAQMLGTATVLKRYDSSALAVQAWKTALTHAWDGMHMSADDLCYEYLMGRNTEDIPWHTDYWRRVLALPAYLENAPKRFEHKRPLILDTGEISMAEGVDDVRLDDVLILFRGAPFPFILRQEGDHYTFLGNCFLEGRMNIPGEEAFVDAKEFAVR